MIVNIKIDNYLKTTRREDDYIRRKNDINYIIKNTELEPEDLMELPDYVICDIAYDVRLVLED